jgi:hypothetical protein
MAAYAIQFRRGTTTQHNSFTGLLGEVTVDTDKKTLVVHDGSTTGGFPLAREGAASNASSGSFTSNVNIGGTLAVTSTASFTDDVSITGDLDMSGHIIPSANITYDLGSPTMMWRDIYVGPGSLYVNGKKVIEDNNGSINFTTDANETLKLVVPGATGTLQFSAGSLQLDGEINAITGDITFGDHLDMNSNRIKNISAPVEGADATNKTYVDNAISSGLSGGSLAVDATTGDFSGDVTVGGSLTVTGTVTTVNSETIELADNILLLNSNTLGNASQSGGIEVERGDDLNVQLLWDETNDRWSVGSEDFKAATFIGNLTGDVTGTVSSIANHDTADLVESATNRYFTPARESAITSAYQTYADTAESDAVITANNYTAAREAIITTSYQSYVGSEISTLSATVATKATTAYVDSVISTLSTSVAAGAYSDSDVADYLTSGSVKSFEVKEASADLAQATLTTTMTNPNSGGGTARDGYARAIDSNDTHVLVGSYNEQGTSTNSGVAYVYNLSDMSLAHTLINPDNTSPSTNDRFGQNLVMSNSYAMIAAPWDETSSTRRGTVYIYDTSDFSLKHSIPVPDGTTNPSFGGNYNDSLAIDDTHAVVGHSNFDTIYVIDLETGQIDGTITSSSYQSWFGRSVAMSSAYIAVADSTNNSQVHVYNRSDLSHAYSISSPISAGDALGEGLIMTETYIIASALRADINGVTNVGAVHVFNIADGSLAYTIHNPNPATTQFSKVFAIDGSHLLVGDESSGNGGRAYIFDLADNGSLIKTFDNPNDYSGAGSNDYFGNALALKGETVVIGAYEEDDATANDTGRVYVFKAPAAQSLFDVDAATATLQIGADMTVGNTATFNSDVTILSTPTDPTDATNKSYVDAEISTLSAAVAAGAYDDSDVQSILDNRPSFADGLVIPSEKRLWAAGGSGDPTEYLWAENLTGQMNLKAWKYAKGNGQTDLVLDAGTGAIDVKGARIYDLGAPTDTTDAVNKAYVDSEISTLSAAVTAAAYGDSDVEAVLDGTPRFDAGLRLGENADLLIKANNNGDDILTIENNGGQAFFYGQKYLPADNGQTDLELEAKTGGKINVNGFRVYNVGTPTDTTDAANKGYVDSEVSTLQSNINTEKGRIDAIMSASTSDADTFAEIVSLVNSVDTTNDNGLAAEITARTNADTALSGRLDTVEGTGTGSVAKAEADAIASAEAKDVVRAAAANAYADQAEADAKAYTDTRETAITTAYAAADTTLQSNIDTEKGRIDAIMAASTSDADTFAEIVSLVNSVDTTNDNGLAAEITARTNADTALSGRLDVIEGTGTGSVAKALVDAKAYADQAEADAITSATNLVANATGSNLSLANKSTSDLSEGSNQYFTNARAVAALEASLTHFHSAEQVVSAAVATSNASGSVSFTFSELAGADHYAVYLNRQLLRPGEFTANGNATNNLSISTGILAEDDEIEVVGFKL